MSEKQDLMSVDQSAQRLAAYIQSLPDFSYCAVDDRYNNIGATIADAVLQPQRDYDSFVTPKTVRILEKWRDVRTVTQLVELLKSVQASDFLDLEDSEGSSSWLGHRVKRFCNIVCLFKSEGIETEDDLRLWLLDDSNLGKLYDIWGVGQKTVNYFGILVGLPWVAIDGRLRSFLSAAGIAIDSNDLTTQRDIVCRAADLLSVDRRVLDHSIWRYVGNQEPTNSMAGEATKRRCDGNPPPSQSSPAA
jgi:hypothetical protein